MRLYNWIAILCVLMVTSLVFSCSEDKKPVTTLFEKLDKDSTNIDFKNQLSFNDQFNIFTYRNYYNGAGVAIGDINNDGLPDLFFTSNMLPNKLYLNKGNFKFEDITEAAGILKKAKWSTGVSMADVNGDGFLDIYVCNSGDIKGDNKQNELYINDGAANGKIHFTEQAKEYGIDDRGFSTHAAFFDFDHDGDLDMFLLNNSFKAIGSFDLKQNERLKRDSLGGHKFFLNENNHFIDISEKANIYGSIIGFGLGVTVGDVNKDGWQDIYVSNDFFEKDYLYINNKNGTFTEALEEQMYSISNASMGADMADINNDAYPDIFVTEMLPEREERIKMNTTFENWDKYQSNLRYGYYHQFTRNMLQLNNGDNTFSEIGRLAGVHATDWSWGALITDLDNDGFKDIFIANGIYQDLTNEDFIHYLSNQNVIRDILGSADKNTYQKLIDLMPSNPLSNYAYRNNGDLTFTNKAEEWGLATPGFSNGSAYGDLDNDGDLDLVVNNLNMESFVYRNRSIEDHPENKFLKVQLEGNKTNHFGVGANITVYYDSKLSYQESMPMRGFESTVDNRLIFGLGKATKIDSVVVKWPDGTIQVKKDVLPNQTILVKQAEAAAVDLPALMNSTTIFSQSSNSFGIDFSHKENEFVDFDRDKLIYHMLSTQGPRTAVGDINGDKLDDIYFCGAKDQPGALYIQQPGGQFRRSNESILDIDKGSEDTDCLFFDADRDGDQDLFVCSGGSEFSANSTALISRLYLNDGKGNLSKSPQLLPSAQLFESASCVKAGDYDKDGDLDLFVGVRSKPFGYGFPCKGYLLQNDGKAKFKDVSAEACASFEKIGMMTDAVWFDYDKDGDLDLVVSGEYMPLRLFNNNQGKFTETTDQVGFAKTNGWWNRLYVADLNSDGYDDLIAANHGLNSRFKASVQRPVEMFASDFDQNGTVEQVITRYNGERSYPMALRHDLVEVLPYLKKKYLKYENYKEQTITDVFTKDQLDKAVKLEAFEMRTMVFMNNSKGSFTGKALPMEAQMSPIYGLEVKDVDGDGYFDLILGGNLYETKPEIGAYDASYGILLKGNGQGDFSFVKPVESGVRIKGAIRDIREIVVGGARKLLVAVNNQPPLLLNYNSYISRGSKVGNKKSPNK